jgi:2',3'-cyclic-nucleotide 2'-phosphodiesterase
MRILFIGDIVGKTGRKTVSDLLPSLIKKYDIDFVIANGENATHGKGLIYNHYQQLIDYGIDCITLGNHYRGKSEIKQFANGANSLIRPANLKHDFPGVGSQIFVIDDITVRVSNLLGQIYMNEEVHNPYDQLNKIINDEERAIIHIVDFHAEATSEKYALAYAFDGQISALIGTHTHVQTSDARILDMGTGYISDVGMTGPYKGIIGVKKDIIVERLFKGGKGHFHLDDNPQTLLSAVIIDIDEKQGKTNDIKSLYIKHDLT